MTEKTCQAIVWRKTSKGIMGKGTESFTRTPHICGKKSDGSDLCQMHTEQASRLAKKMARKMSEKGGK